MRNLSHYAATFKFTIICTDSLLERCPRRRSSSSFRRLIMRPVHCTLSFSSAASIVMLSTPVKRAALSRTQDSQFGQGLLLDILPIAMLRDPVQKINGYYFFLHPHPWPNCVRLAALSYTFTGPILPLFSVSSLDIIKVPLTDRSLWAGAQN